MNRNIYRKNSSSSSLTAAVLAAGSGTSQTKRLLSIGAIAAGTVIVLVLVFFGTRQFAGQAVYIPIPEDTFADGSAGIVGTPTLQGDASFIPGELLVVQVGADIGSAESVAFEFELHYPADAFEFYDVVPRVDWGDGALSRTTPGDGSVRFEYATVDYSNALTGEVFLAEVRFSVREGVRYQDRADEFTFGDMAVWSFDDPPRDLISGPLTTAGGEAVCVADDTICGQFCGDNAESYCNYDTECPSRVTCPSEEPLAAETDQAAVTAFCQVGGNAAGCQQMCTSLSLCPTEEGEYTVDINGDNVINGQDAFIILKIAEALGRAECGAAAQVPCGPFSGTYTCDSGDFRVDGYNGFTFSLDAVCSSFVGTAAYVGGGS